MSLIQMAEKGWLPDPVIRYGIRRLCAERLQQERSSWLESKGGVLKARLHNLRQSPIAIDTDSANEQHYEVPAAFFQQVLGAHLKYSCCWWSDHTDNLDAAEEAMLRLYEQRADLQDGQRILELGCGWGSLSLWMAKRFPNAKILAVSNSHSQRKFIEQQARQRDLFNLRVITCDVNSLQLDEQFDRVVSVEMFEHMRNYQSLMHNISQWLTPGGYLFVHLFCHRDLLYPFETDGSKNWMGRYFFTGGQMPSADTLSHFQQDLQLKKQWEVSGTHYELTALAWLANLDERREEVLATLGSVYGHQQAAVWLQRWRMFFMSCAELFGYKQGREWFVCHYRFERP